MRVSLVGIIVVLFSVIALIVGSLIWNAARTEPAARETASSFEDCKKVPGSIVQETFPERCVTPGGQTFIGPDGVQY
jgi:hypothetical protein